MNFKLTLSRGPYPSCPCAEPAGVVLPVEDVAPFVAEVAAETAEEGVAGTAAAVEHPVGTAVEELPVGTAVAGEHLVGTAVAGEHLAETVVVGLLAETVVGELLAETVEDVVEVEDAPEVVRLVDTDSD